MWFVYDIELAKPQRHTLPSGRCKFTLMYEADRKSLKHGIKTGSNILRYSSNVADAPTPK